MKAPHLTPADLAGKTIDVHSHVGLSLKAYANLEYPYAQTVEGLYYRQLAGGVDVNVVFPYAAELYWDLDAAVRGEQRRGTSELAAAPYVIENQALMREVFTYCPELARRFMPFVSIHPTERVGEQLKALEALEAEYPVYGIKFIPVFCRAPIRELLDAGRDFVDFARERDIPMLMHVTGDPNEEYSQPREAFAVAEANPGVRFGLAHCLIFSQNYLEMADRAPNVWFDTAALKIQTQMVFENSPLVPPPAELFDGDYSCHVALMRQLVAAFPETIMWGSDSPAYAYICRRQQAAGHIGEFRLKGTYEDEVAALEGLAPAQRRQVATDNTLRFLFGDR